MPSLEQKILCKVFATILTVSYVKIAKKLLLPEATLHLKIQKCVCSPGFTPTPLESLQCSSKPISQLGELITFHKIPNLYSLSLDGPTILSPSADYYKSAPTIVIQLESNHSKY